MTTAYSPVLDQGNVARALPQYAVDGAQKQIRVDPYGGLISMAVAPTRHQLSDEGSYILATNPTIGTGMVWVAAQTSFVDTGPNFYIFNPDPVKSLFLDYLKMSATAVATTASSIQYAVEIDIARSITTNHVTNIVPVNPNMRFSGPAVNAIIQVQNSATASVFSALSGAGRIAARGNLGGLNIAGDELLIAFGCTDVGAYPGQADAANQPGKRASSAPPVIIGPNQSAAIYIWMPGSAASFNPEFELGMWAR